MKKMTEDETWKSGGKSWWTGPYWKLFFCIIKHLIASWPVLRLPTIGWFQSSFANDNGQYFALFSIPVSNFLLTIKEFFARYGVWCGRQDCPRSSDSTIDWFCEFCCFICLWTFSKSMDFLQKAFNKAYGVTKSRGIISHQLMSSTC